MIKQQHWTKAKLIDNSIVYAEIINFKILGGHDYLVFRLSYVIGICTG